MCIIFVLMANEDFSDSLWCSLENINRFTGIVGPDGRDKQLDLPDRFVVRIKNNNKIIYVYVYYTKWWSTTMGIYKHVKDVRKMSDLL